MGGLLNASRSVSAFIPILALPLPNSGTLGPLLNLSVLCGFSLSLSHVLSPMVMGTSSLYHPDWPQASSCFSSIQFSCSVMSDSLRHHGLQHARPPCPSQTPGVYSNPCPLSQWCHPPSHPLLSPSRPAFNLSQRQGFSNKSALRIRWPNYWSFSFSISLPMNTQDWSPLRWTGWESLGLLAVQGTLKSLLQHHSSKASILPSAFLIVQLSHPYMTTDDTESEGGRALVSPTPH